MSRILSLSSLWNSLILQVVVGNRCLCILPLISMTALGSFYIHLTWKLTASSNNTLTEGNNDDLGKIFRESKNTLGLIKKRSSGKLDIQGLSSSARPLPNNKRHTELHHHETMKSHTQRGYQNGLRCDTTSLRLYLWVFTTYVLIAHLKYTSLARGLNAYVHDCCAR